MVHMLVGAFRSGVIQLTVASSRFWLPMNSFHLRNAILKVDAILKLDEITLEIAPRKVLIIKGMTVTVRELICFLLS